MAHRQGGRVHDAARYARSTKDAIFKLKKGQMVAGLSNDPIPMIAFLEYD